MEDSKSPERDVLLASGGSGRSSGGRRRLSASQESLAAGSQLHPEHAKSASALEIPDYDAIRISVHPDRPKWYEAAFAWAIANCTKKHEAEVADYKRKLISSLGEDVKNLLEIGVGTGINLKFYSTFTNLQTVVGVDPILKMVKYCEESARLAGLDERFEFRRGVGEGIPAKDESMDAVVCTLTLCSVSDVAKTLQEVKRILKPGGAFIFLEHVAAEEGTLLRFLQGIFNPFQRLIADNCYATRKTLKSIEAAQFSSVQSKSFRVNGAALLSPHVGGVAYK